MRPWCWGWNFREEKQRWNILVSKWRTFFGGGVGGDFLFLSFGTWFYLRLLLTLGTPATDTVKHHSLLLGRRPSSWAVRPNKNRAGPRPLDARGQARPCRTWTLPFLREENYTAVRASLSHLKEREGIFLSVSSLRRLWGPWWGRLSLGKPLKRLKNSEISTLITWHGYDTLCFIFWRLTIEKNRAWHIVGVQ